MGNIKRSLVALLQPGIGHVLVLSGKDARPGHGNDVVRPASRRNAAARHRSCGHHERRGDVGLAGPCGRRRAREICRPRRRCRRPDRRHHRAGANSTVPSSTSSCSLPSRAPFVPGSSCPIRTSWLDPEHPVQLVVGRRPETESIHGDRTAIRPCHQLHPHV